MRTENTKEVDGKFIKVIETEGLPKERIEIIHHNKETDKKEEIYAIFGSGKITIIFEPK